MNSKLTTLRDELAERAGRALGLTQSYVDPEIRKAWLSHIVRAMDDLLSHLEGAAGEFDEAAAKGAGENKYKITSIGNIHLDRTKRNCFSEGARWQFDRSRARIGLAEQVAKDNAKLWAQQEQLEARLAESERRYDMANNQLGVASDLRGKFISELQAKLAAAEAENARLRAALEGISETIMWKHAVEIAREALK